MQGTVLDSEGRKEGREKGSHIQTLRTSQGGGWTHTHGVVSQVGCADSQ